MTTMTSAVNPARMSLMLVFAPDGAFLPTLLDEVLRATKKPLES
jgi:hypothetical protein